LETADQSVNMKLDIYITTLTGRATSMTVDTRSLYKRYSVNVTPVATIRQSTRLNMYTPMT